MNDITVYSPDIRTAESLDEFLPDDYDHRDLTETLLESRPSASLEELDEVYSDWNDATNMSATQLKNWSENPCSREASVNPSSVIKRNLRLLETGKSDWDADDIADAKRTISFVARMDANKPESPQDGAHGCPTDWAISMLNWAHNPFSSLPGRPDGDLDSVDAVSLAHGEIKNAQSGTINAYRFGVSEELEPKFDESDFIRVDNEQYTDEPGFVLEPHQEDFGWEGSDGGSITVEVPNNQVVYTVGFVENDEIGSDVVFEDALSESDRDAYYEDIDINPDPEEVDESTAEESVAYRVSEPHSLEAICEELGEDIPDSTAELASVSDVPGISRNDMGLKPWPESWRESNKPARAIALDAWVSMGASFRGCRREMAGTVKNPNKLCASWKDELYGTTYWRN